MTTLPGLHSSSAQKPLGRAAYGHTILLLRLQKPLSSRAGALRATGASPMPGSGSQQCPGPLPGIWGWRLLTFQSMAFLLLGQFVSSPLIFPSGKRMVRRNLTSPFLVPLSSWLRNHRQCLSWHESASISQIKSFRLALQYMEVVRREFSAAARTHVYMPAVGWILYGNADSPRRLLRGDGRDDGARRKMELRQSCIYILWTR